MIIINATLKGENTYEVTIGSDAVYRVSAFTLEDAFDRIADHLERHGNTNLYRTKDNVEMLANCSKFHDAEEFATVHKLTKCGINEIYIEVTNVKGCLNG